MAFINDNLKTATIALTNFAASGALGTPAATVDIASSFVITQTTAGITLTLPTPTDATAGDRLTIASSTTSTTSITVAGISLVPGEFAQWQWTGSAWAFADGGRNTGAVVTVASVVVGNNTVTHNLAMPTGSFSSLIFRAYNATGNEVTFRRVIASDTTNALVVNSSVALTNITFYITPLV